VIPAAALVTGIGALLFGAGSLPAAYAGRLLQGAGGVFALIGAVYIASRNFPPSRAATLIGGAQMFGMAGGSAGQFLVGPLIAGGTPWSTFWIAMGIVGLVVAAALAAFLPKDVRTKRGGGGIRPYLTPLGTVFRNPQSILCGAIAGLLFIPTTIFDMTWGVRFLQEGHGAEYGDAVMRSATVPMGWIVGCPLLGYVSDSLGRRKPVIVVGGAVLLACLAWILYGKPGVFPPYALGFVSGLASGAAMIPYTVIKEANPPQLSGTATGVINFLNLGTTALLGPVFGWMLQHAASGTAPRLAHYQTTFQPLLYGVALALLLTIPLKETGKAAIPIRTREAA
jgi:MFS family permease